MGAYVSISQCKAFHSVNLNCTVIKPTAETNYSIIGGLHHGEFEPNPDVAGIGILYAFFSVACLALVVSALYLVLQTTPFMRFTGVNTHAGELQETMLAEGHNSYRSAWADTFEAIILSCSDQQVFTSGAYAVALRYSQGCSISAYHYNIVANMLLITCATHLMSVTVVSQYWKHKLLAVFRILLVTALYIVTALLLTNQNAGLALIWPTALPLNNVTDTLLVLPAACFQGDESTLDKTLQDTFGRGGAHLAIDAIGNSTPNNHIVGWNFFVLMVLWYGAALIAEIFRLWYHRSSRARKASQSKRTRLSRWIGRVFWFYQFAGTVFCSVAIVMTYLYIQDLRGWIDRSPWLKKAPDGTNPENDSTTFGQLVPLLLILLTVFTTLQLVGDMFSNYLKDKRRGPRFDPEGSYYNGVSQNPHSPDLPEKKDNTITYVTSVPATPVLELNDPIYQSTPQRPPSNLAFTSPVTSPKPASTQSKAKTTPVW